MPARQTKRLRPWFPPQAFSCSVEPTRRRGEKPPRRMPQAHPMQTALCKCLGIEVPIIQAPMAGAVGPQLAAAVSNAGGLGMLVLWRGGPAPGRRENPEPGGPAPPPAGGELTFGVFPKSGRFDA